MTQTWSTLYHNFLMGMVLTCIILLGVNMEYAFSVYVAIVK